tara:strand:- start:2806 stop:3009 length:204 start_codon:yes stop_codon:yes gene_type:complete
MRATEFIKEDDGGTYSGDVATVATNLFSKPLKRKPLKKKYANSPSYDKYTITGETDVSRRSKNIIGK